MIKYLLGVLSIFLFSDTYAKDIEAKNGLIDISTRNWNKDGSINLSGEWDFYWDSFLMPEDFSDSSKLTSKRTAYVPAFWNKYLPEDADRNPAFGYATYRLQVICPPSSEPLALKILTIESAYKLYINGQLVTQEGRVDSTIGRYEAILKPKVVNVTPLHNKLDIVVQVANFDNRVGGLWDSIRLGTREQMHTRFLKNISLEFFVAGFFFLAFIYYFILFCYFNKRQALIYLSLLCLIISIRALSTGEMPLEQIFHIHWQVLRRAEYISLFFSVPAMVLFSYHLFRNDFSLYAVYLFVPIALVFELVAIFGNYYNYTYLIDYYRILMLIASAYGLFVYIKAAVLKREGSYLFLLGFMIFLISVINDILGSALVINTIPLAYAGIGAFVIVLAIMLAGQFHMYFKEMQWANEKLQNINEALGQKNKEVSEKNIELEKMNREMDSFVHRTSHDLKAPLISIVGINELMKQENSNDKVSEYVDMQQKTLRRMDDLIHDIIDFSKNKRLEPELNEISFHALVSDALHDHAFMDNAEKVRKIVSVNQFENFVSDNRRISIIINNLISNALKYADLSKPEPCISIMITVADNNATIEVADNGIGIDEDKLDKIFILFYRITNSAKGSGLGLHIIKETVEKLGGYIVVSSKKGDGSSFKVMLPNMGYRM